MSSAGANKSRAGPLPNDAKSGPKGEAMTPIPSASLIVLCPPASTSKSSEGKDNSRHGGGASGSSGLATLMLQRSARMGSSFRSAVVFPGGALDLADQDAVMDSRDTGSRLEEEAARMAALQICSLRETFEETGLLLLPSERASVEQGGDEIPWSRAVGHREAGLSVEEWREWREKVHQDASTFRPFLTQIAKKLQISSPSSSSSTLPLPPLTYFSHWITPRSVVRPGKRFSAHFFLTVLDLPPNRASNLAADLSADGTETLSLRLDQPETFVREAMEDRLVLYPPQFYILADLAMLGGGEMPSGAAGFEERVGRLRPLAFGGSEEGNGGSAATASGGGRRPSSPKPTAVEEEPRDLPAGMNYAWDRHTPNDSVTGWVATDSTSQRKGPDQGQSQGGTDSGVLTRKITSVEPRALPKLGGSKPKGMPALDFGKWEPGEPSDPQKESKTKSISQEEEEGEAPFIFPLVLPGDHRASPTRQGPSSTSTSPPPTDSSSSSPLPPLNRVYVSPRSHEDGGGLVASGAVRRGLPGLRDWRVGVGLVEDERAGAGQGGEYAGMGKKGKL